MVSSVKTNLWENSYWESILINLHHLPRSFGVLHCIPQYYEGIELHHIHETIDRFLDFTTTWTVIGTSGPTSDPE